MILNPPPSGGGEFTFRLAAIDPGVTGAIFFADVDPVTRAMSRMSVHDMPVCDLLGPRPECDEMKILEILREEDPAIALIEHVNARSGRRGKGGAVSEFGLAKAFVAARSAVRFHFQQQGRERSLALVAPTTWKKALALSTDKKESLAMARREFQPMAAALRREKDKDRAEAMLLALYYTRHLMEMDGIDVI